MSIDNCKPESLDPLDPLRRSERRTQNKNQRSDETQINKADVLDSRRFLKQKKAFSQAKLICKTKTLKPSAAKKQKKKFCICPCCSPLNLVLDKVSGKTFFTIPFTKFKIPRLDHLKDLIPTFDKNRRPGEKCPVCANKRKIEDPTDDSAKYEQVAQQV